VSCIHHLERKGTLIPPDGCASQVRNFPEAITKPVGTPTRYLPHVQEARRQAKMNLEAAASVQNCGVISK
jgi:hypothetical protein